MTTMALAALTHRLSWYNQQKMVSFVFIEKFNRHSHENNNTHEFLQACASPKKRNNAWSARATRITRFHRATEDAIEPQSTELLNATKTQNVVFSCERAIEARRVLACEPARISLSGSAEGWSYGHG